MWLLDICLTWINLTTNQDHWDINNLIGQVGKYQVGGFPFNWTFLNLRTTFQFLSLVKAPIRLNLSQSRYTVKYIPCIKDLIHLYSIWSEVRLKRISLRQLRPPHCGANGLLDAGPPNYNTPSRYLDSTTKSPYDQTVVNQYIHRIIEAAGQRQISGEYLPLL